MSDYGDTPYCTRCKQSGHKDYACRTSDSIAKLREEGCTWQEVARIKGLGSETAARRAAKREANETLFVSIKAGESFDFRREPGIIQPFTPITISTDGPIRSELRPLGIEIPKAAQPIASDVHRVLMYGDTHYPFQDDSALAVVRAVGKIIDPTIIVHMGDLLDCYHLSRFDKNPSRSHTIQDEIDQARAHLASMRLDFPNARFVYLGGNHEARLEKTLWNLEGPASALNKLTRFREVMTIPALLGLDELRIEFVPPEKQSRTEILPKMLLKHGTVVRKWSSSSAKGEWEKSGRSGASGHVHRLGLFFHAKHDGGAHAWAETGCTCTLTPEYADSPDWQHGCVAVTIEKSTGAFAWEPVYAREGHAVFRGQVLKAGK